MSKGNRRLGNNLKRILFLLLLSLGAWMEGMGQNFTGYLYDTDQNPVELANVAVLSKADSSLVKGTVTDNRGYFSLLVENPGNCRVKITSLCYKTLYIEKIPHSCDTFKLDFDTKLLDEVVVKGHRNVLKKGKGKITASIENSPLAFSGNANDVLARLPLLVENNGDFKVMGKGTPALYINGRLIEDNSELLRLKSNEIKSVEIITTPGVEYDSSLGSVIKIRTIPLKGEGFSGNFQGYGAVSKRMSEYVSAHIKYRYKGFDLFLDGDLSDYRGDYVRRTEYISLHSNLYRGDAKSDRLRGHFGAGMNGMLNADHSFGLRYNLTKTPKDNDEKNSFVTEKDRRGYTSLSRAESDSYKNYLNFYYTGKCSSLQIDLNADYSSGKQTSRNRVEELKEESQSAHFRYGDNYDLFASKLLLKYPLKNHTFLIGGEYSFTNRKSDQKILSESNIGDLFSSSNQNKQHLAAVFANYDVSFDEFNASLGIRYEHTVFNYWEENIRSDEQSKKYNELVPHISVGYEGDNWQGELSFRKYVDRPSYEDLSNKVSYVAYCARWSGNPFLLPSVNSELGMQFSWNNFTVMATWERVRKQIFEVNQIYRDKPDVILVIPVNLPAYNSYSLDASYQTRVGIWEPSLDVTFQYQDLKYGTPEASYNKPIAEFLQRNYFHFKHDFNVLLTMGYRTKGNFASAYTNGYTNLGLTLSKSFLHKSLLLKFDCKDMLNKYRESISVKTNGLSMLDTSKGNTRIFQFSITYFFNKSSNRYKGKGAALEEINRL